MQDLRYCKRLIEIDLPIKRLSEHARREKDMRRGHVPLMHIWPATRPPAACRAIICGALWPDPADDLCPITFRDSAYECMKDWILNKMQCWSAQSYSKFILLQKDIPLLTNPSQLRDVLLNFIADFAIWENSINCDYLRVSRKLTESAYEVYGNIAKTKPVVLDPFAGGGTIPLEALRVGANSISAELNPVAVLLNKVILEYVPKYGVKLIDALREWENWMGNQLEERLGKYYPKDEDGSVPTAYLWARTILSEAPTGDKIPIEIPMLSSMVLSNKSNRLVGISFVRDKKNHVITEEITRNYCDGTVIKVRQPIIKLVNFKKQTELDGCTVKRCNAVCPVTGYTTSAGSVKKQLNKRVGGALDARVYAVAIDKQGRSRSFRLASKNDQEAYELAKIKIKELDKEKSPFMSLIPNEKLPLMSGVFNSPIYGHNTWSSLFNYRQQLMLATFLDICNKPMEPLVGKDPEFVEAVMSCISLIFDKVVDNNAAMCMWQKNTPNAAHVFGRWALPMIWDYAEVNPLAGTGGSLKSLLKKFTDGIEQLSKGNYQSAIVVKADATKSPMPDDSVDALITDPPYYNAIPYADISDFFYIWLKRFDFLKNTELFASKMSPKEEEITEMAGWDPVRYLHKNKQFFETKMTEAFLEGRRIVKPNGICIIVFAHKTTEGWEALLQAIIDAGWVITSSWPIDTEMVFRMRGKNSAALSSSIHLVCRPREDAAGLLINNYIGDWRDVLQELPKKIHDWMPRLAMEGVVGADAIFSCLGPALEIFSRYSRVEKANGEEVKLSEYLEQIWGAVAKEALNMIFQGAHTEGFEEDARLTAMWLWTLFAGASGNGIKSEDENGKITDESEESGIKTKISGFTLEYDAARKIAQGLGAHLEELTSLVEIEGETARLLPVEERVKYLFGKDSVTAGASKRKKKGAQLTLDFVKEIDEAEQGWSLGEGKASVGKTILDRVHQSMILFAAGRSEALRRFLVEEGAGKDDRFWRLSQSLSALYPHGTDEKRWVDGVLAKKKSFGF